MHALHKFCKVSCSRGQRLVAASKGHVRGSHTNISPSSVVSSSPSGKSSYSARSTPATPGWTGSMSVLAASTLAAAIWLVCSLSCSQRHDMRGLKRQTLEHLRCSFLVSAISTRSCGRREAQQGQRHMLKVLAAKSLRRCLLLHRAPRCGRNTLSELRSTAYMFRPHDSVCVDRALHLQQSHSTSCRPCLLHQMHWSPILTQLQCRFTMTSIIRHM